jgi:hypothetical protein
METIENLKPLENLSTIPNDSTPIEAKQQPADKTEIIDYIKKLHEIASQPISEEELKKIKPAKLKREPKPKGRPTKYTTDDEKRKAQNKRSIAYQKRNREKIAKQRQEAYEYNKKFYRVYHRDKKREAVEAKIKEMTPEELKALIDKREFSLVEKYKRLESYKKILEEKKK